MLKPKKVSYKQRRGASYHRPAPVSENLCASCVAANILAAATSVRSGEIPMPTNADGKNRTKAPVDLGSSVDLALAFGFIVLVLICLVAEGFYFLQLPI
jgi:hypothetical protein